jgi:drug/metabolite transporter (DMT)-like permease
MQVLTLIKAVSIALTAGALSFLLSEWRYYKRTFAQSRKMTGPAPDTGRLMRRTFGSAVLLAMSVLMFMGELPQPGQSSQQEVLNLFYYWSAIVGLALLLGVTAMYDAMKGMKRLGSYVTAMEGRELATLAKQLKKSDVKGDLLGDHAVEEG